jgi:hypothetical protein
MFHRAIIKNDYIYFLNFWNRIQHIFIFISNIFIKLKILSKAICQRLRQQVKQWRMGRNGWPQVGRACQRVAKGANGWEAAGSYSQAGQARICHGCRWLEYTSRPHGAMGSKPPV